LISQTCDCDLPFFIPLFVDGLSLSAAPIPERGGGAEPNRAIPFDIRCAMAANEWPHDAHPSDARPPHILQAAHLIQVIAAPQQEITTGDGPEAGRHYLPSGGWNPSSGTAAQSGHRERGPTMSLPGGHGGLEIESVSVVTVVKFQERR